MTHKKAFAVAGIFVFSALVITAVLYLRFFSVNPNWGEYHSLFYSDRVWIDSSNGFTLSLNQYNEYGILTKDGGSNSFVVYFELSDREADHKQITVKQYKSKESAESLKDDSEIAIYGGWEYYEETGDTLIIWIDQTENGVFDESGI